MRQLLTALVAALLIGCASSGTPYDPAKTTALKRGETTREDVVHLFGQPPTRTQHADGRESYIYTYVHSQVSGKTFIPVYGAFAGGARTHVQILTVNFDHAGKVSDFSSTVSGNTTSMGVSSAVAASEAERYRQIRATSSAPVSASATNAKTAVDVK